MLCRGHAAKRMYNYRHLLPRPESSPSVLGPSAFYCKFSVNNTGCCSSTLHPALCGHTAAGRCWQVTLIHTLVCIWLYLLFVYGCMCRGASAFSIEGYRVWIISVFSFVHISAKLTSIDGTWYLHSCSILMCLYLEGFVSAIADQ